MSASLDTYRGALEGVDRVVNRESEADEVLRKTVEILHDRFDHYSWVGIYLVEGDDLVLGPWKGPQATEHVRIPIGAGHLRRGRGERRHGDRRRRQRRRPLPRLLRLDAERDRRPDCLRGPRRRRDRHRLRRPAAFGPEDRTFLERVATLISPALPRRLGHRRKGMGAMIRRSTTSTSSSPRSSGA